MLQTHAKTIMNQTTGSTRYKLLVVEDEADLQELLRFNLEREGMNITLADTGEAAVDLARQQPFDLILLDLMLPRMDGLEVCRRLKADEATAPVPVIMVTAKGEEADVVIGLELGADDYITKPFSTREMVARVKAVLRRSRFRHDESGDASETIMLGPIEINADRHEAHVDGERLDLTATEFRLLLMMTDRPGRVFTRQQIIERLHGGHTAVTDRSVDVQVVSLRRKLGKHADLIQTVRGVGYRVKD